MKILLFADVHGNITSLKALFNSIDFKTADVKICLGDIVSGFASPEECVQLLKNSDVECMLGNNDAYVINGLSDDQAKNRKKWIKISLQLIIFQLIV